MARPSASTDAFAALGDPRRREIVEVLGQRGEQAVGELVQAVGASQPSVSKHLAVLRLAGVVVVARRGRERRYSLNAAAVRGVHEWTRRFEHLWAHQIDRIRQRAEARATRSGVSSTPTATGRGTQTTENAPGGRKE